MVAEIPVLVNQKLTEFIHNEPNNNVTRYVMEHQDNFGSWGDCFENNVYRSMKLLPVEFLLNGRYIFAKLDRMNNVTKSIEKIVVLDEFKNPIMINSTFLTVNGLQRIVLSENNLVDLNLPLADLPYCELSVGIDIDGFGHNPKYVYIETVEINRDNERPDNVFGILVQGGFLFDQPGQVIWIDDSLTFSVLPYTGKYQLPGYELEIRTDADFDMGLNVQGIVINGLAREFGLIPKASYCLLTVLTDQEFSFLIFPDVHIDEQRFVDICGKTVVVNDGFIGFPLEELQVV